MRGVRMPGVQKRNDSIGKGQGGSVGLVLGESSDIDDAREMKGFGGWVRGIRWDSRVDFKEVKAVWVVCFVLWSVCV